MKLEDILEKIKRLENGGNGTNMVCFIVAFDFLYFLNDTDNRNKFIYEYYKNDNKMFANNLKKVCYYAESILLEDDIYNNMLKSIEMEVNREELVSMYNYYDTIDTIEKANISAKDLISDGFKIRLLKNMFSSSNEDYSKLSDRVNELKTRYERNMIDIVTIISIFIAIVIGMVSGISFSLEAFSSINRSNINTLCLVSMVTGFVIFNLFYIILKYVSKMCGKDIDKKGNIIFIEVVFVALIIFFLLILSS